MPHPEAVPNWLGALPGFAEFLYLYKSVQNFRQTQQACRFREDFDDHVILQRHFYTAAFAAYITLGVNQMLTTRWRSQEVPLLHVPAGIVCASGEAYEVKSNALVLLATELRLASWINVAVLVQQELSGGEFVLKCGEALEHGSIGVVVLESKKTGDALWSFASSTTNPFDQVAIKGSSVLVISTSGAVLRFSTPLNEVSLLDA